MAEKKGINVSVYIGMEKLPHKPYRRQEVYPGGMNAGENKKLFTYYSLFLSSLSTLPSLFFLENIAKFDKSLYCKKGKINK